MLKPYTFTFPLLIPPVEMKNKVGRPRKDCKELSLRARNKRHDEIFYQYSAEELKRAAERKLEKAKKPAKQSKIDVYQYVRNNNLVDYHQSLALLHDARLSKLDYNKVRSHMKKFATIKHCRVMIG